MGVCVYMCVHGLVHTQLVTWIHLDTLGYLYTSWCNKHHALSMHTFSVTHVGAICNAYDCVKTTRMSSDNYGVHKCVR